MAMADRDLQDETKIS